MKFEVLILGNSSATPIYGRHPTGQIVNFNEQLFLIDCGEGTQMQLARYGVKSNKINHIFISHLHGDHYLGLVGLLSSMHLSGRQTEVHLYGPAPLEEIVKIQLHYSDTMLRYPLIFHATNSEQAEVIFENRTIKISSFPLTHRIPTTGFRFDEGERSRTLIAEKVEALHIPIQYYGLLKRGVDYVDLEGNSYFASELTLPPPEARSYAYCSDTVRTPSYLPYIQYVNLLYHETTFLHELVDRAKETFHTTSLEAAEIAKEVHAQKLLLGHYSARYKDLTPLLLEAQTVFPNAMLSEEGKWYQV